MGLKPKNKQKARTMIGFKEVFIERKSRSTLEKVNAIFPE